jgi:type I restriction enzyme, S subunit
MKEGTKTTALGEVVDLVMGQAPSSKDTNFEGRGTPFVKVGEFGAIRPVIHEWTTDPLRMARRTDVLLCVVGATCGKINLGEDCAIGRSVAAIRPHPAKLNQFYLYYFMATLVEHLRSGALGAAQTVISKDMVATLQIPLPSIPEQERIVNVLDEAFEGLALAKANTEKNLQNARALFKGHLQSVFTQRGPGWVNKPFEELVESNLIGLNKNSREQGQDKGWHYVKMNNITRDNRFDYSSFTCVDATPEEVSKFSLKHGDFLFNTRNSHELVGKSCIYESYSNDAVLYNNNIMRVRFQRGIDARFVLLAFASKGVADALNALKSGTTNVSAIYFKDLKSLVIPVPPIAEQKKIAAKLESLGVETQRLARLYERKLAALEALKKSLLHQAFSGQLS